MTARRAERIQAEAEHVLAALPPDAPDRRARRVTEPLYEATTQLYVDCNAEVYREVLTGRRELNGACAEPGAPTLAGPRVIVYGSSNDFVDSTCLLVQGEPIADGCSFRDEGSVESAPGDFGVVASEEVAFDPDTCRSLHERGRLRGDPEP